MMDAKWANYLNCIYKYHQIISSWTPEMCGCDYEYILFKFILMIDILVLPVKIPPRWR